ncbi:centriole and centriolar satellite protein ofd1 isoform X3 [Pangasianodon hypophthalmus]|uniref:centriole and centriolar satellite protein ofd1 isoform X3 n=1 Tax=Pangasianodon hypophthalmus TaxID=310915 RepID=UPI0023075A03|nr:centriole and centriolar satellite protein ofd1 isoform X3 [Pangasianodon hypophthalmus]
MSAEDEEQCVSAEELRQRLYRSFKQKGVLDAVKTQLRNQLIVELQRESLPRASSETSASLLVLASDSLVIDHLQSSGYEYTLSVFYPECGISKDKVFSTKDILRLLRISPHSPVCRNLDLHSGQKGLLMTLLSELIDHRLQSRARDADTQTSDTPDYRESIVKKLQVIDEEYEVLRQKGQRWASVEAKLADYRKEMEEQAQAELKSKIQHFQEVEISRVRMEEREKCRQEVLELRRQLERNYEMKSEALMSREKNAIERLQKQQQMEETELHGQRQALLREIESVRSREAELRLRMEAFENSCKLHEEKMRSSEELLRKRELDVRKMEETYELKLNSEIRKHQLELKEDYGRRTKALTANESKNKEETARIQREAAVIDARREEHERVVSELSRVQEELESARGNVCALEQQNAALKEKLEGVSDYASVRSERVELQAEVRLLKKQLEESQEEKQRLRQELNTPSPELLTLQAELKRLEVARRLDHEDFQNQKQVLHVQLAQEVERCAQLKAQLLECEERTRWMSTHTEELKQQLRHTQQALENEVLRNPKPSLVDRSVLDLNAASVVSTDVYVEGYRDDLCDPGIGTRGRRRSPTEGEEMVAAALNRIQELEKEAETLEEAYRSYRRKGVASHIAFKGTSPPPPCTPATFVRPTGAAKNRVVTEDVYAVTELNQRPTGHMTPPTVGSPPIRRLSSTPVSASKTKPRAHTEQEVMFSGLSSESEVSLIPAVSSEEHTHITPPSSPQLKSTARDNCSPPKLQMISSSSQESSPQPEKISLQDLTEPQTDFPYSSEQQIAETHTHEEEERRMKEEEERRWQEERRMKEERRRREREEAEERERRELERLQQELLQQEDLHGREKEEEEEEEEEEEPGRGTENRDERPEVKTVEEAGDGETEEARDDPLRKYMLMVMQGREREREQNMKKDESENQSPEPLVLSDHKDDRG